MIDPQGQAVSWIRSKESANLPPFGVAALNDPKLRDKLEFAMGDGKALIVLGELTPKTSDMPNGALRLTSESVHLCCFFYYCRTNRMVFGGLRSRFYVFPQQRLLKLPLH